MAKARVYDGAPDGVLVGDLSTQPVLIGGTSTQLVAFHGYTQTSLRTSAKLTAGLSIFTVTGASVVAATTATFTGLVTFTTTQMIDLWDAVKELRAYAVEKGLLKGGA